MSSFGGLGTAMTGLDVHRRRIEVISENIANVNTPGYRRRVVDLAPVGRAEINGLFAGSGTPGTGVEIQAIRRLEDGQLEANARDHTSVASGLDAKLSALQRVEEAVGGLTPGGIGDQLTDLWNSFDDLGNAPDDTALREIVLQKGQNVAAAFNRADSNLATLRETESAAAGDRLNELNRLASQIADMDSQALSANADRSSVSGLLDRRDQLVTQLADLAPINVVNQSDGQLTITVDGHFIVSDGASRSLELRPVADADLGLMGLSRLAVFGGSGRELSITTGQLGGRLASINQAIPDSMAELDAIAATLTTQVNTAHEAGVALDGSTGNSFFDLGADGAGSISLNADVLGQPAKLAAAGAGAGPLDDSTARQLAGFGELADGPRAAFDSLVTSLAGQVNAAGTRSEAANASAATATNLVKGATGVSLDEELTDLVIAQRSYEAAARLITTIDQMLETLISRTGLVGR